MTKRKFGTEISSPIVAGNDTATDMPVAYNRELQGAVQTFANIAERDAWANTYKTRLKGTISFVESNADGSPAWFKWDGSKDDGSDGSWVGINVSEVRRGTGYEGIELDDGKTDVASINKINLPAGSIIRKGASNEVTLDLQTSWSMQDGSSSGGKANSVSVEEPLQVYADPDKASTVRLGLKHGMFQLRSNPSYLAYLSTNEQVIGKEGSLDKHTAGSLWFDDVIVKDDGFIQYDRENKAFGIQEADDKDPNVTGGMNYLISFRASLKGIAPNDGFVRAYLMKKKVTPQDKDEYLLDVNGQPMGVEKNYKMGDVLGSLDVLNIVNAKGLTEFTCHVIDNFADDLLNLNNRTQGGTGLLIQALSSNEKTGNALLEYESDTQQNINFDSYYLGDGRLSIEWLLQKDTPIEEGKAGQGQTMVDGLHLYNATNMKAGIKSNIFTLQDNGSDLCYFNFGKIFNSEETNLLKGKDINTTVALTDKKNAFYVYLMKWSGKPDEYTKKIITGISNSSPIFEKDWVKVDELFISEDAVNGVHSVNKTFTVPDDANNYAVIIAPTDEVQPLELKLNSFDVDVVEPFVGYVLKTTENLNENHLRFSEQYKELAQDRQGYGSLRYTLTNKPIPMPIGELKKGLADISIDSSVNKVAGSAAKGGEGAIVFEKDGSALINTSIKLQSEQASGTRKNARFWFSISHDDGKTFNKIVESETDFIVYGGNIASNYKMKPFRVDVQSGDKIILTSQCDTLDGAYMICTDDSKPMLKTTINFKEILSFKEY